MPVAALFHTYAITIQTLELFRVTQLRCPQLSIEAFVKSLNDMHLAPPRSTLAEQFSIAYDVYEDLLLAVDKRIQKALLCDKVNHRIKHACPCCMYELEGEAELMYHLLFCMDGNNSLKRVLCTVHKSDLGDGAPPESSERTDTRGDGLDYFLSRERVDTWTKELLESIMKAPQLPSEEPNLCEERWENMKNQLTTRMWGIFDETGIFLALCPHGFVLVAADMVRSGELAKYPLAIVEYLFKTLGGGLAGGYDIGCKFGTTLNRSPLGPLAKELNYVSLVGSFHGHAHNRLCQTANLTTYREGVSLEDLEGCERFFSRMNAVAGVTRYASKVHRRCLIGQVFRRKDVDTYEQLSKFLANNYEQALDILAGERTLKATMMSKGIADEDVFKTWLQEERTHLLNLKWELPEESLQMEYLQKLELMTQLVAQLTRARERFQNLTPETMRTRDDTRAIETAQRHTGEKLDHVISDVHILEEHLGIELRWTPESEQWIATAELLKGRKYRRALDMLKSLVIARLFELTKMNQSQTACSHAIGTALDKYNAAAAAFKPPKPPLLWNQVVEYAFLADFDLLRESRMDIREKPWASPWGRLLMDQSFKIAHAKEEISHLNIEIRRLDPRLAFHIDVYRQSRARFNARHLKRLTDVSEMVGFTGTIVPGVHLKEARTEHSEREPDAEMEEVINKADAPVTPEDDDDIADDADELSADDDEVDFAAQFELLQIVSDE
ncbi:hypothetical protein BDZ89DRAFT_1094376 [Hymenopellis radicata]|nr:hypothetical protein BDZ89DRAFT_1094376 [Hymenopellis radicata]